MKQTMKAGVIQKYGQKELEIATVPIPEVKENDVLVKIIAASINPIDLKTKDGKMKLLLHYKFPLILGSDFAGIVTEVGAKVTKFEKGDQVYGRVEKDRIGTFAEYIAADQKVVAFKPQNLSFEEAAAIPLVGLTSYQALHEIIQLKPRDKVLIQAGSGGIGTIAIQLAKLSGAFVATTTSAKNVELVKSLGADQVIDYHQENFEEVLHDYDAVFDTQGGATLEKAFQILKPKGKVVSISGIPDRQFAKNYGLPWWKQALLGLASRKLTKLAQQTQTSYHFLFMKPSGEQLAVLTKLLEDGKLYPMIDRVLPFEELQEALEYSKKGHAKGKIIIKIASPE